MSKDTEYCPKGSMCMRCKKWANNCSTLRFKDMPVMDTKQTNRIVVRCTEFRKLSKDFNQRADSSEVMKK